MIVQTSQRRDNTIATITLFLDGLDTSRWKKFKCSVCGGTVFRYKDTLKIELPLDVEGLDDHDLFSEAKALDEVECNHWMFDDHGKRVRCRTFYLLMRGNFRIAANG